MKIISRGAIVLVLIVLSASLIHAQDLSRYRIFSLGMSLTDLAEQIDAQPTDITVVHEHPALIQELAWVQDTFAIRHAFKTHGRSSGAFHS